MTSPNVGRFTWHELMTKDSAATAKFYTSLFGWTVQEMDMGPMGTYRLFMKGDKQVGGAMNAPAGVPAHWMCYVDTANADATVKKITEHGGKMMVPPTDVPGMVRFAVSMDPQGAAIGIVQNISDKTPDALTDAPAVPGTFCWDELLTKDVKAAATYYGDVFGWTGFNGDGGYWHWQLGQAHIGGMMTSPMPNMPPAWMAYIAVSDVEASAKKVTELGGKVIVPMQDVEKVGKFSIVQDPSGATFALFRSARV